MQPPETEIVVGKDVVELLRRVVTPGGMGAILIEGDRAIRRNVAEFWQILALAKQLRPCVGRAPGANGGVCVMCRLAPTLP